MAVIEPPLALRLLRHLTLDFRLCILRLASEDLRRLADAWPDLEELLVNVATIDSGRAGLESIVHFARGCPRLRVLHRPVMDLAVGAFDGLEYPAELHPLQDLSIDVVVGSHEEDLRHEMAAFIQRVFSKASVPFESGDRSLVV